MKRGKGAGREQRGFWGIKSTKGGLKGSIRNPLRTGVTDVSSHQSLGIIQEGISRKKKRSRKLETQCGGKERL